MWGKYSVKKLPAAVPIVAETRREFSAKTKGWRAISFAVSPWNSKTHSETDLHHRFTMFGGNVPSNSTRGIWLE
jgi:hypothetical protein